MGFKLFDKHMKNRPGSFPGLFVIGAYAIHFPADPLQNPQAYGVLKNF